MTTPTTKTTATSYLPIELNVRGRRAAAIGGDAEVLSKVERLLAAGADVWLYDLGEPIEPRLAELAATGRIHRVAGEPSLAELEPCCVVFAAPEHEALGARLHQWALAHQRLFCQLDRPSRSTFANPAALTAGGIGIRLFSGGASPALVQRLREDLQRLLADPRLERLVARLAERRASLPLGLTPRERAERLREAVAGFGLRGELAFPAWLDPPPPS